MIVWEGGAGAWKELTRLRGHKNWVTSVAFSPDGKIVATGSLDRKVKLWDVVTGADYESTDALEGTVWAVAFSPDGKSVAVGLQPREGEGVKFVPVTAIPKLRAF